MKFIKQGKILLLLVSVTAILCMGVLAVNRISDLQMKTSQALTWVRVALQPTGALPTAEAKTAEQSTFWLPDFLIVDPGSGGAASHVMANQTTIKHPDSMVLASPVFNPQRDYQDWNNCGPATLALGLRYWDWQGDQFTISEVIRPKRQDKNVNIEELADYVNLSVEGLRAEVRVGGSLAILESLIAGGYPVIIEKSFTLEKSAWPGDDLWAGHYILVTGYDQQTQRFTVQDSYYGPDRLLAYDDVVESWQAFNHVYLVVFPEEDLQKIQQLLGEDWPMEANLERTAAAQQNQILSEPTNAFAWFNLGSSLTAMQEYDAAVNAFDTARALGLPSRMLRYQFGPLVAAYQTGDQKDLSQVADFALLVTPDSEEALLWKARAFEMTGDHLSAIMFFNKALEANPGYTEAKNELAIIRP